jgi:hypothetical protein
MRNITEKRCFFDKNYLIKHINCLRDETMLRKVNNMYIVKNYATLYHYEVIFQLKKLGYLKVTSVSGAYFYKWNFDSKVSKEDLDVIFEKSFARRNEIVYRAKYNRQKRTPISLEDSILQKLEPIIEFKDEKVVLEPLIKVNEEEKATPEIRFDIKSKNNKILSVNIIVNTETKKLSQSKNILLHKKFKNWTNEERDKYLSIILTEEELRISKYEIENIKRLFYEENQIDLQNEVENLKKELEKNTNNSELNQKKSTKYLKLFGIKIYEKN